MNKEELEQAFSSGGERELSCAVEYYGQPLLRYCQHILCDYYLAQDAVQETFFRAYQKRKSFRPTVSLSAWLYRIAYHACIDLLRQEKRVRFTPKAPSPGNSFIRAEVREALGKLTAEERALVFARVMEGRSYAELSQIHHVPEATLRKRYERAKKKLAQFLSDEGFLVTERSI